MERKSSVLKQRRKLRIWSKVEALMFFRQMKEDNPSLPFLVLMVIMTWAIQRWLVPFSNWVPVMVAVWATTKYVRFQQKLLVEDLNKRWKRLLLNSLPITPLEPCQWLNKLLIEVWPNYLDPKLSRQLSSVVERHLREHKPKLLEKVEVQEFSLGSSPPTLGSQGVYWTTVGEQQVMHLGLDWNANDASIILSVKLGKPLLGTTQVIVNSIYIKGDIQLLPVLEGQAILYSFESTPEVRIDVAIGNGRQTVAASELPWISTWLVKIFTDFLVKTVVEPRRRCFPLPLVNLARNVVGGALSVTVVSARNVTKENMNRENSEPNNGPHEENISNEKYGGLSTFLELELEDVCRRTDVEHGQHPIWNCTFDMLVHDRSTILHIHLYEWHSGSVKHDYIASCEIRVTHVGDGSTIFWAIGPGSTVIAKHSEHCTEEVEMVVPFEGMDLIEVTVRLQLKDWQYSDDSKGLHIPSLSSLQLGPNFKVKTDRKLKVTVVEGRNLLGKDRSGKSDPYVKLQYGKANFRSKVIESSLNPVWNESFELDEIVGGEYLKVKCYSAATFGDDSIGSARLNLEGVKEGVVKDFWVPLEKVNTGELRLQLEAVKREVEEHSKSGFPGLGDSWIELIVVEAKDLAAAGMTGSSDPYVKIQCGKFKRRSKVMHKTLSPLWNQRFEFPDTRNPILLHVKDQSPVLSNSNIGHCTIDCSKLVANHMIDKWIPLQGAKTGQIHIKVLRKVHVLKETNNEKDVHVSSKANEISRQLEQIMKKVHDLVDLGDNEGASAALKDMEIVREDQETYMVQLEKEKRLLLSKIKLLAENINKVSPLSSPQNT